MDQSIHFFYLLFLKGVNGVELFYLIKEHFALLSVFMITIFASVVLFIITWKRKENLPGMLPVIIMSFCLLLIGASIYGMIFFLSFGYNA